MNQDFLQISERVLKRARAAGADDAEVFLSEGTNFSTRVRQGTVETVTEATTRALSLRVFVDQRVARASASDLREETLEGLVRRAVERAREANQDPFAGLPEETAAPPSAEGLNLYDPALEALTAREKIALARKTEQIGLELDPRVKNSGGAGFSVHRGEVYLANTRGFQGGYRATSCSLGLHLLGQEPGNDAQVSDYWYSATRQWARLESPEEVARRTVERVRRHFGARKLATQEVPVVFEPLLAAELLSDLFAAVTGEAVYLRRSFLADLLGQKVAAEGVTVVDDGLRPGGLGTQPFDGEGVASQRTLVVENSVLRNYLCGTYSARKLGRKSTGNGTGDGEAPTNFYLAAGPYKPEDILRTVDRGLYVTRLMGQGVNLVTGDYSRGAFGLWIERGQPAYPVHEVTISGNLRRMLQEMEMVGSDLEFRGPIAAPTVKISAMTVAGT
ncbi:TldD/PmbA family protein [Acidobacteriia bacterium AH_259_A11_L15]|nr:TldD/PmbA family protein [Acidobacteriia bacterium AH_259_A11_L15]